MAISLSTNGTTSQQIKTGAGTVYGIIVNSHTSGTIRLNDGLSTTTSAGVKATAVLTTTGVFTAGETITLGDVTYTMVSALTGVKNQVLIGGSTAIALDNLKAAVNKDAGEGTTYGTGTVANPQCVATTNTDTEQTFEAMRVGTYGNSLVSTETCANASFVAGVFQNGAEPSTLITNTFTFPAGSGVYNFGEGIRFNRGLYLTVGGTIDYTIIWE